MHLFAEPLGSDVMITTEDDMVGISVHDCEGRVVRGIGIDIRDGKFNVYVDEVYA